MAVHSYAANALGKVGPDEIALNLEGSSHDVKKAAAARFGRRLIEARGKVADADIDAVRSAGYTDAQIVEIVALTAQVLMTNFMNNVAETEIDIPPASRLA
jgi:alkylhydroperoxidase family enzyme